MGVTNEPAKIPDNGENTDSFSHWQIYNSFHPLDTTNAHTAAQQYSQIASQWSSAASFFAARIRQSSSAAWQGKAAEASRTAISNYAQRAEDLTEALNALSTQVHAAVDGVNGTKNGVAVPMQHVSRLNFWDGDLFGHHGIRSKQKIDQARDDAREAMKNNYVKNFVDADKKIPVIPKPNEISNPLYSYTPTSTSAYTPNSGTGPSNPGPSQSTSGDSGSQSGTSPSSSQSDSMSTAGYSSSSLPSMSGYSSSMATSPAGYYSGTSPTSTTPSNYSGVGSGTGGDSALNGLGSATGGGLGKSVTGTGSNAATTAANAAKAASTTGGMAGMGGMGGAAGKGKGEDDKEHSLPDWLRNMENAEELLGPAPKSIPGGVIGGDFDQTPDSRA